MNFSDMRLGGTPIEEYNMDTKKHTCPHCDEPGGIKTYEHQVSMSINGRVQCIDYCIHRIIASLNAGGVETVASCCGHQKFPGHVMLQDGRKLLLVEPGESFRLWTWDLFNARTLYMPKDE